MDNSSPRLVQSTFMEEDPTAEIRRAESDRLKAEYLKTLEPRNNQTEHKYSPNWQREQPKTAIQKYHVTPEEQEEILFQYAVTSSIPKTVKATGCDSRKVRAVIFAPDADSVIVNLRNRIRANIIDKIGETQFELLDAIQDPTKLQNAGLRELASVFSEISSTQMGLISAQKEAAGGSFAKVNPEEVFSGEDLHFMALMRRKADLASAGRSIASGGKDFSEGMEGHEFVDAASQAVDPGYEPMPEIVETVYDPFAE